MPGKRLPVDMKGASIKNIEDANRFLEGYVQRHNERFAVAPAETENAFMPGPPRELLPFILSVRETRKIAGDSTISWHTKKYIAEEKSGVQKLFRRGTSVTVLTLMDGSLAVQKEQEIFSLKEISHVAKKEQTRATTKSEATIRTSCSTNKPKNKSPWRNFTINAKRSNLVAEKAPNSN